MQNIKCKNNFGTYSEVPLEKFIFRPSVYGLIVNKDEIVTLVNKGTGKLWFPGGGVEINETLEQGLAREITEETGLSIDVGDMILFKENFFYYQPTDEAYHAYLFFYLCHPKSLDLISDDMVDDLESTKPRWTKIGSIKKDDISDLEDDIFRLISRMK